MDPVARCIVCDARPPFPAEYERGGYRMVRCPGCGLVFQDPQPGDEALARAYYHDEGFAARLEGDLRELTLANARDKLSMLARAGVGLAGARVLDVGASSGAWLEVVAAAGARATGIEIGETVAAGARARGLDVRTGTLGDTAPALDGPFDLITFWDVLEHLRDPRAELRLTRGLLAPGGHVAFTFPNVDGLYPRLTLRLLARRTGVWEYPELPVHLYDFSPLTARRLLGREDLAVRTLETYATPFGFYRQTSLSPDRLGTRPRERALRAAFEALHVVAYPLARLTNRGNAQFVLAAAA